MKKVASTIILCAFVSALMAQDVKSIKKVYDKNDLPNAKTQIDAFVSSNPLNPEGLYLEAKIYNAIAANEQLKNTVPDARMIAFEAFKKAMENSKGNLEFNKLMLLDQQFYKPLIEIYSAYYDQGAASFNVAAASNNKADFEKAMDAFINADKVGHYISDQKLALSPLDTALVLNIGRSAVYAGKNDLALQYLKRLADANIHGTKDGSAGYDLTYQWFTLYYKQQKDEASMLKYANLGKQYFPKDDYYDAVLLDYYRDKKDHDALFKQYQHITSVFPDSLTYHFNYANDAFNYVFNSDEGVKVTNKEDLLKTIHTELGIALKMKPTDINTNWLMGQYYFNQGVDLKDMARGVKGTTPADVKKKADLNAQASQAFNTAIPYAQTAMTELEASSRKADKSRYKSIVDLMQRIYGGLQKSDQVKVYQNKYDAADAKFVN